MKISEKDLARQFVKKNKREEAFRQIISQYQERLYWHIRKIVISHDDTDDILQNTFIKAWENADKFRNESGIFTWLYRIATNESLTFLRKEKKNHKLTGTDSEIIISKKLDEDPWFNGDEIQKKFQKAIASLPERQRLVFNMKYFDEMKYEDMAKILKLSTGALKASYHHAVKKIKNIMLNN